MNIKKTIYKYISKYCTSIGTSVFLSNDNVNNDKILKKIKKKPTTFEFEMNFLDKIYSIEKKFGIEFFPVNWPLGYLGDVYFCAYITFDRINISYPVYTDYYKICIYEDILTKEGHGVYFYFNDNNDMYYINEVYKRIGIDLPEYDNSIDYELNLLANLSRENLDKIGDIYSSFDNLHLFNEVKNNNLVNRSIDGYVKLLRMKHNFKLLKRIGNKNRILIEGIIPLIPKSGCSTLENNELSIRFYNDEIEKIYFVYLVSRYNLKELKSTKEYKNISLSDLLKFAGINKIINNEFDFLFTMTNEDLYVVLLIIEEYKKFMSNKKL